MSELSLAIWGVLEKKMGFKKEPGTSCGFFLFTGYIVYFFNCEKLVFNYFVRAKLA